MTKWFLAMLAMALTSCTTTYYSYYEVSSPDMATTCSIQDATWNPGDAVTRCVAIYPDSTGHMVYLMETKSKLKDYERLEKD